MRIVLADEISPRFRAGLWDIHDQRGKLDKDRFRRDLGGRSAEALFGSGRAVSGFCLNPSKGEKQGPGIGQMKAESIRLRSRPAVLDPQGKAIGHALNNLGYTSVGEVRQGQGHRHRGSPKKKREQGRAPSSKRCARSFSPHHH